MSDILRRGRLDFLPDEEIMRYTSSMEDDKWIFDSDILVDFAHTVMLKEQGIIPTDDCAKILDGLKRIHKEGIDSLDHSYEDLHISIEAKLIDMVGEDVGGRMHSGRSRNDEVATCIRLRLRKEILEMAEEMLQLVTTMAKIASDNHDTIMPGYTHLQHAQPTTLAHHIMSHAESLGRDVERILGCLDRINRCPLGAAAFASTGFPIDRSRTAELLGFEEVMQNSMDAVSGRDFLLETASVLANIMIEMSRISEELVLWSSTEFAFIELSDQYASTSSIMPQKKNPDTAELVRGKSGIAVGSLMSLLTVCKSLPMSYNRDMQDASPHIWKSVETTRASVRIMAGMLDSMKVNNNTMKLQASTGFTTATELADTLVRECGIPFRTAHQIVGILAKRDVEPTLEDIEAVGRTVLGESLTERGLNENMVKQALDPMLNIQKRKVIGGPAPEAMKASIDSFGIKTGMWIEEVERIRDHTTDSIEKLMQVVEDYIQQK